MHADTPKRVHASCTGDFIIKKGGGEALHRLFSKPWKPFLPHTRAVRFAHTHTDSCQDGSHYSQRCSSSDLELTTQGKRTISGSCGNTHFERLQKVTGARQTAQDSSMRSQASSSPRAQTSSHLISFLPCTGELVRSAQCCILICTLLRSIQQQFSPERGRAHYPAEMSSPGSKLLFLHTASAPLPTPAGHCGTHRQCRCSAC